MELLAEGRTVRVGEDDAVIEARRGTDDRPLLKLRGVADRAGAEALGGAEVTVSRDDFGRLEEGAYLAADLVSLEVKAGDEVIGRVREVLFLPSVEALEVERPGDETLLVPLVKDAIRAVDLERREVQVNPGFLDLELGDI
jgi:16S rRNA processing protein RimM